MDTLPPEVRAVINYEGGEVLVGCWFAYHRYEHNNLFDKMLGQSWDYEGYLILTTARTIFVHKEGTIRATYEVIPHLSQRLEEIHEISVRGRDLFVGGECYKIAGARVEAVRDQFRQVVAARYQGTDLDVA
jgi:hypothetical protein